MSRGELRAAALFAALAAVGWCLREPPPGVVRVREVEVVPAGGPVANVAIEPTELRLPLYPGAQPGSATAQQGDGWRTLQMVANSADPPDQVAEYYRRRLPDVREYRSERAIVLTSYDEHGVATVRLEGLDRGTRLLLQRRAATPPPTGRLLAPAELP